MTEDREPEREVDRLSQGSERLDRQIDEARSDWRSKQADQSVPGAVEGSGGESDSEAEATGEVYDSEDEGFA